MADAAVSDEDSAPADADAVADCDGEESAAAPESGVCDAPWDAATPVASESIRSDAWESMSLGSERDPVGVCAALPWSPKGPSNWAISVVIASDCSRTASSRPKESSLTDTLVTVGSTPNAIAAMIMPIRRL